MRGVSLLLLVLFACASAPAPAPAPPSPSAPLTDPALGATSPQGPTIPLAIGHRVFQVEVADTEAERARGLMYRDGLAPDHGMVFVYPDERERGFWMKNTRIPLAIAFVDAQGQIVHIAEMLPYDERTTPSRKPAMYAVEMSSGWFTQQGVSTGDRIQGLPQASRE